MSATRHLICGFGGFLSLLSAQAFAASMSAEEQARFKELDSRPLYKLVNVELEEYLRLRTKSWTGPDAAPSPAEELGRMAVKALDQPNRLFSVRFDLSESDCVVMVERCIALSLSWDWETFYKLSERLRHKDGRVEYRNRNFHTLGDWLGNNAWLLKNISKDLGPVAKPLSFSVRPKVFKTVPTEGGTREAFVGSDFTVPAEKRETYYVPVSELGEVLDDLRTGDIVPVIEGAPRNPGCNHLGIVFRTPAGRVDLVHSAPPKVRREPLASFAMVYEFISGFTFLRLVPNAPDVVRAELEHTMASLKVPTPAEVDRKNAALREARARSAKP